MTSEELFVPPNATELERIMTDYDENHNCFGSNRWTDWYSTSNITNGSDFEILADHVNIYGSVRNQFYQNNNFLGSAPIQHMSTQGKKTQNFLGSGVQLLLYLIILRSLKATEAGHGEFRENLGIYV